MDLYLKEVFGIVRDIHDHEKEHILAAAHVMIEQTKKDRLIYTFGPGGHSNPAATEILFRADGLMHVSTMLNQDTMFSCDMLESMQTERLPGFSRTITNDYHIGEGGLLVAVNACGINSTTIDAMLQAKESGATVIGVSSHRHVENHPKEHPARYPSEKNLHEIADCVIDCKVGLNDAIIELPGFEQKIDALGTFADAYVLNNMVIGTINILNNEDIKPPVQIGDNAPGGDEWSSRFTQDFCNKIRCL